MNNCAQNSQSVVPVYAGDEFLFAITRDQARVLRDNGEFYFANHGKELRKRIEYREQRTPEQMIMRSVLPRMARCAMNRGRAGQNIVHYPIPYCYEGHVRMPVAKEVNACAAG